MCFTIRIRNSEPIDSQHPCKVTYSQCTSIFLGIENEDKKEALTDRKNDRFLDYASQRDYASRSRSIARPYRKKISRLYNTPEHYLSLWKILQSSNNLILSTMKINEPKSHKNCNKQAKQSHWRPWQPPVGHVRTVQSYTLQLPIYSKSTTNYLKLLNNHTLAPISHKLLFQIKYRFARKRIRLWNVGDGLCR